MGVLDWNMALVSESMRCFKATMDRAVDMTTGKLSLNLRLFSLNPGSSEKGFHVNEQRFALWDIT